MGAHTVSVTDGVSTVQLNDTTATLLLSYPMVSPMVDQNVIAGAQDGANLSTPTWGNVEESLTVLVIGATTDAVRATINSIEAVLDRARQNRLTWGNARCFLQVQIDAEASTWRSEILEGRVTEREPLDGTWKNKIEITIQITRRYFWEGPRTPVYMETTLSAETTDPVAWHNGADDVTLERNLINIAANRVTGVLPTPLELKLTFGGTTSNVRDIYIGNHVWMDPANLDPILLGTDAAEGAAETWATDGVHTTHTWTLTNAQAQDFNGQYVRPLVAFSDLPDQNTRVLGSVLINLASLDLQAYIADAVRAGGRSVLDVGAFPIPPRGYNAGNNAGTKFRLSMQKTGGDTLTVHSLHLMPSGDGLFRRLRAVDAGLIFQTSYGIVDDGIEGVVYLFDAGGLTYPTWKGMHSPIHVWPNRINRLRVLVSANPWAASIAWTAQGFYLPRRLTL